MRGAGWCTLQATFTYPTRGKIDSRVPAGRGYGTVSRRINDTISFGGRNQTESNLMQTIYGIFWNDSNGKRCHTVVQKFCTS